MRSRAIITFAALAGATHAAAAPAPAACRNPAFLPQAQAALRAFDADDAFSGAVLVAVDGRPVLRQGVGLADRELGVANTPDMRFRLGSITKQFTAAAILQLQEAGKLSVDDPITKYVGDAPPAWSKVTLRHLLTHTSGIADDVADPGYGDHTARLPHTPAEVIALVRDQPMMFAPGSRFDYNNFGYALLGMVIEKVSGQSYADYLRGHIFGPLGMAGSGVDDAERIVPGRASGYQRGRDGTWGNAPFFDVSNAFAAGSLISTVDDLLVWDQALSAARPLNAQSLQAMFTDYGHEYGFGFDIDRKWDRQRISHNGLVNGFTASFQRYPKAGVTAIALANEVTTGAGELADDLAGLCLGAAVYPAEKPEAAKSLDQDAGFYQIAPLMAAQVTVHGGSLAFKVPGQAAITLFPEGGDAFFAKTASLRMTFQKDAAGRATGALLGDSSHQHLAKRLDPADSDRLAQTLAQRIAAKAPAPGAEDALRRVVVELQRGTPDYDRMSRGLAERTRQTLGDLQRQLGPQGAIKSIAFEEVGRAGSDVFIVRFEKSSFESYIALSGDGRIDSLVLRPRS